MLFLNDKEIVMSYCYPDGTFKLEIDPFYLSSGLEPTVSYIKWRWSGDCTDVFVLQCLVQHIRNKEPNLSINLIVNYFPFAREDNMKNERRVFTLKYLTDIINSLNFNKVTIQDAHSPVLPALLDRVDSVEINKTAILEIIATHNIDLILYPDNGAEKKYSDILNFPYIYGIKHRHPETGKLTFELAPSSYSVGNKNILIVDDICAYGGTIHKSATALKDLSCNKVYVYVTHLEKSVLNGNLLEANLIETLYASKSLFSSSHPLVVLVNDTEKR